MIEFVAGLTRIMVVIAVVAAAAVIAFWAAVAAAAFFLVVGGVRVTRRLLGARRAAREHDADRRANDLVTAAPASDPVSKTPHERRRRTSSAASTARAATRAPVPMAQHATVRTGVATMDVPAAHSLVGKVDPVLVWATVMGAVTTLLLVTWFLVTFALPFAIASIVLGAAAASRAPQRGQRLQPGVLMVTIGMVAVVEWIVQMSLYIGNS